MHRTRRAGRVIRSAGGTAHLVKEGSSYSDYIALFQSAEDPPLRKQACSS